MLDASLYESLEHLRLQLRPLVPELLLHSVWREGAVDGLLGEFPHGLAAQTEGGGRQLVFLRQVCGKDSFIIRL